ncbi:hypothetical protein [Kitasatospora sp. RG8]|uniref:tyrosine-type recombinase/integrase n=1 Tax=Kitasatospora sp. RG8 TaxID=2820815 RepID=UPI001FD76B81|nr:hypothetical protein [Kitasatospora sp. RG8]
MAKAAAKAARAARGSEPEPVERSGGGAGGGVARGENLPEVNAVYTQPSAATPEVGSPNPPSDVNDVYTAALPDQQDAPEERVQACRTSTCTFARTPETFSTHRGLALPTDQAERLAVGRRKCRVDAVPESFRPAVAAFDASRMRARDRARRASTRPRSNLTLEAALATMRDLAVFLTDQRGKGDWALVDVHDIEAFLATLPRARKRRLTVLRQFFGFARSQRVILVDPTRGLTAKEGNGYRGRTLTLDQQRHLFRRWTCNDGAHPHEALLGMLALLHGASGSEVRMLQVTDIDPATQTVRLGKRPHPVPLDPASWAVLQRCLAHRAAWPTQNPHVMVTKGTKGGRRPASTAHLSHVLDDCGYPPRMVRGTRLVDLVNTMDPKLVAAAFGMDPQATLIYLADHIDPTRFARPAPAEELTCGTLPPPWPSAPSDAGSRSSSSWGPSKATSAPGFAGSPSAPAQRASPST